MEITRTPRRIGMESTCLGLLPKSGSETLLLWMVFLPSPAHPLIVSTDAEETKDDMDIADWLFPTLEVVDVLSCS